MYSYPNPFTNACGSPLGRVMEVTDLDIAPLEFLRGMSGVDFIDSVQVGGSEDDDDEEECSGRSATRERYTSSPPTFALVPVVAAATIGAAVTGAVGADAAGAGPDTDAGIGLPVIFPGMGTACLPGLYIICCSLMGIGCMADIPARILSMCS